MQRMRPFELHAVKMSLHIIQAVCCRTVPHAGFAAIQDDNLFFGTFYRAVVIFVTDSFRPL
jgi:hypothetical protein